MLKQANWITSPTDVGTAAVSFQKKFALTGKLQRATLFVSSLGVYSARINGAPVSDAVLAPGFTSYRHRILYQEYDVTALMQEENLLDVSVGQGWAVGFIGYIDTNHVYADRTAIIARLLIEYSDGSRQEYLTDTDWEVYSSVVRSTEIYHGETVDLTHTPTLLGSAVLTEYPAALLPQDGEWIREQERIAPIEILHTPKGETVIDFGQNLTGYVEIRIQGKRGERILLHHAEVLDREGNFYTANLRSAKNENLYVLSGGEDLFKPTFTFQGFRYVRLTEFPSVPLEKVGFTAIVVHSDLRRTGEFQCGNEKINQLYHNVIWGQKGNFLDIPTDCPQRDERLGWTGDAHVFCRTACINYDSEKFFAKWLADLALAQRADGAVYGILPDCFENHKYKTRISAAWGDVACVLPWELYVAYGSTELLRRHFPIMKKWVDYLHTAGPEPNLWLGGYHYGDWLAMDSDVDSCRGATSTDLIASAFFAHSTDLLIKAGHAIGEDVSDYEKLHTEIRSAFRSYFMENGMPKERLPFTEITETDGKVDVDRRGITQTSLALILRFGLCTEEERPRLTAKLAELIRENGNRLNTGFVGTPHLLHALSENGECDLAYTLLFQEESPSWLYSVNRGATTMWEHWNGIKEDGSFWSKSMNSFNHYAYGAVYDWIFGVAIGICPSEDAVGYKHVTVSPHPDQRLGFAKASIESRQGKLTVHWYYKKDRVFYELNIPQGMTVDFRLPSGKIRKLTCGSYCFCE